MKKKFLVPFLVVPMLFSCASNDFADVNVPGESSQSQVIISQREASIKVGESVTLIASNLLGSTKGISWAMDRNDIVSISTVKDSGSAIFTGLTSGTVIVTAMIGDSSANCVITVGIAGGGSQETAKIDSISLDFPYKTIDFVEGGSNSFVLTATVKFTGYIDTTVTWSSNAPHIVSVEKLSGNTATVTALEDGVAIITGSVGGKSATCQVTVNKTSVSTLSISLNRNSINMLVGDSDTLIATTKGADTVEWLSNSECVTVSSSGVVTAVSAGTATITATAIAGEERKTAQCNVVVKNPGSEPDYTWNQPGHLYIHYLRHNHDYDDWAVYIWQKMPNDIDGTLYGATKCPENLLPTTTRWMNNSECGGSGTDIFEDENGQIVDIDLTRTDLIAAKTGNPAPLIEDWNKLSGARLGFLIVDQNHMDGSTHWVSDGGSDTWIKQLDKKMPNGINDSLHLFCVEGSVKSYTTEAGQAVEANPTINDTKGDYVSKNDITNLLYDKYSKGVNTSTTFLDDRPGTGYQIFVPSFADSDGDGMGDLRGIINSLDYLEDLGIDVLWLTPIQESDSYHGYDVTDYYKIDSKFGTMEDYQELIFKAHQKGMKVLMDMVINHTSKNNVLFNKSEQAKVEKIGDKTIEYRNMYLWKYKGDYVREWDGVEPASSETPANYKNVKVEDSEDWYRDGTSNYYYFGKFGSGMAELNYSYQATRDYMADMCKYWLSFGLDGFRLDAIKHIYLLSELDPNEASKYSDNSQIRYDVSYRDYYDNQLEKDVHAKNDYSYHIGLNVAFWKQFAGDIKSAYPNCFLVGENFDGYNKRIAPFYEAIDSQFDFSTYYHLNESTVTTGLVAMGGDINATLNYNKAYRKDHINGAFTSNHDIARLINHAAANSTSTHHAEITPSNAAWATERAKWFGAITIFTPGLSWIYYGDELGMSGNLDNGDTGDHGNNTDRWYRQPMRWGTTQLQDGVTKYTFSGLTVTWDNYNKTLPTVSQQQADPNSIYNYFKAVCHAKQHEDYPTYGYINNCWGDAGCLVLDISDGTRRVLVTINGGSSDHQVSYQDRGNSLIGNTPGSTQDVVKAGGFTVVKM